MFLPFAYTVAIHIYCCSYIIWHFKPLGLMPGDSFSPLTVLHRNSSMVNISTMKKQSSLGGWFLVRRIVAANTAPFTNTSMYSTFVAFVYEAMHVLCVNESSGKIYLFSRVHYIFIFL